MNRLKKFRLSQNESQEGVARLCDIPLTTYQKLESGTNNISNAKYSTLKKISGALNVKVDELIDNQNIYQPIQERELDGLQKKNLEVLETLQIRSSSDSTYVDKFEAILEEFNNEIKQKLNIEFVYTQSKAYLISNFLKTLFSYKLSDFPHFILIEVETWSQSFEKVGTSLLLPIDNHEWNKDEWERASIALLGILSLFQETVTFTEVNEIPTVQASIKNSTDKVPEILRRFNQSNVIPEEYKSKYVKHCLEQFLRGGLRTESRLLSVHQELEYITLNEYEVFDNSNNNNAGNGTIVKIKSLIGLKVL